MPINDCSLENSNLTRGSVIYVEYASGTFDPTLIYGQHSQSVCENVNFPIMLLLVSPRLSVGGESYVLWLSLPSLPSPPQASSEGIAVVLCVSV